MADSIGSVIRQWLRENNLEGKLQENEVPGYWADIVGDAVARHATVERIDRGRMFVRVESAVWRNELAMRRDEIRRKVNERLGAEIVTEIVLR